MNVLTSILLICAAGMTLAWLVAAQRRLAERLARRFLALPSLQQVALVLAVGVMTASAQKQGTSNNEQGTSDGESSSLSAFSHTSKLRAKTTLTSSSANPCESAESVVENLEQESLSNDICSLFTVYYSLCSNDLARGYALVEVRTNATVSYEMPTNGTVVGTWGRTGAYQDVVRVSLATDFTDYHGFPWGGLCVTSLWAHTWGKVRPRLRDRAHEIVAVGTPMSCVPGEGRLWTAATTNGGWTITWEKFREGRRAKNISAQIEFFPNGDFITRSNSVERVYRRVNPDDWDDDGIVNEEDSEPMVAADETRFGPHQTLPDGANSNAYCWVDVVVPQANAKVTFSGDGASNLADPSFIAKASEAHRVAILIGKTYRVTCPLPFRIAAKSSGEIEETWNGANEVELRWPVSVNSCVTDDDAESDAQRAAIRRISVVDTSDYTLSPLMTLVATADVNATTPTTRSQSFVMSVVPSGLGGLFDWTKHCCSISGTDYAFEQTCRGRCACSGCSTEGYFEYEGYRLSVYGPPCPCTGDPDDDDDPGEGDDDDDPPSRGVSAYFTKSVIFFEDEYDNTPTEHVGWRSTETVLKCSASGGEKGGLVKIEIEGADNLVQYDGESLPYMKSLKPDETISFKNRYRAAEESREADEIKVKATFVENETEWSQETTDEATAVRVEVRPRVFAPENECAFRHRFGIGETFDCFCTPVLPSVSWRSNGRGTLIKSGNNCSYRCPLSAEQNKIVVRGGGIDYIPRTNILEPQAVLSRDVGYRVQNVASGQAGGILLTMTLHVLPLDVSFSYIRVEEVPDAGGSHSGYFADTYFMSEWYHGVAQGAGVWNSVFGANEFMSDEAGFARSLPQTDERGEVSSGGACGWTNGTLTWDVPCGWADSDVTPEDDPVGVFSLSSRQIMRIDVDGGCEVQKHGNTVRRELDGTVYLNGRLMP